MRPREHGSEDRKSDRLGDRGGLKRRSRYIRGSQTVDHKDYELLRKFLTERGKIIPCRFSGTTAKQQRQIKRAIRRARVMGLLP